MTIKAVVFDMENTLVMTKVAAKDAYKQGILYIARQHGLEKESDKLYSQWKRQVHQLVHESDPAKRTFRYSLQQLLISQNIPDTYLPQAVSIYQKDLLANISLQHGTLDVLNFLHDRGFKIALVTESPTSITKKMLKKLAIIQYFDIIVTSNDIGTMKPNPQYYQEILRQLKLKPHQLLAVGDSQKTDIIPAENLGIHTYLIPSSEFHLKKVIEYISEPNP